MGIHPFSLIISGSEKVEEFSEPGHSHDSKLNLMIIVKAIKNKSKYQLRNSEYMYIAEWQLKVKKSGIHSNTLAP